MQVGLIVKKKTKEVECPMEDMLGNRQDMQISYLRGKT